MSFVVEGLEGNEIIGAIPDTAKGGISFAGTGARLVIGSNVSFGNVRLHLESNSLIIIGNNCDIEGAVISDEECSIFVGEQTRIAGTARLYASEARRIIIGKRCVILGARFRTSDSHSVIDLDTQVRINKAADIVVQDDVFIDRHSHFYKGSNVGTGSYVAIGSIVTRKFANNSYIEGRPASVVHHHITWQS